MENAYIYFMQTLRGSNQVENVFRATVGFAGSHSKRKASKLKNERTFIRVNECEIQTKWEKWKLKRHESQK